MDEVKNNFSGIILWIFLVFLLLFGLVNIFLTAGFQITVFLTWAVMFVINSLQFGTFFLGFRKTSFRWADGTNGVISEGPEYIDEDRVRYWVTVYKEYVPKEKKKATLGGLYWLLDTTSSTLTIPVIDRPDKFQQIPHKSCNDPNGCINYQGSIAGLPLSDDRQELIDQVMHYRDKNVKMQTIMREVQNQANLMAQSGNKDLTESGQVIHSLMKNLDAKQEIVNFGNNQRRDN